MLITSSKLVSKIYYYAPTPNRGATASIKRCICLMSDVCLSVAYIGSKLRRERPRKTKIGTGVAHVTWLGHHFQGQKLSHQAALITAALTRQAAAAVSV